jgi:hypothetical protein
MPHFGLMDATKMSEADAALLRVRLHLRGARRRFQRGMLAAGIASLYDALQCAMRWYILSPDHRMQLGIADGEDFGDDKDIFAVLARGGVLDTSFDFDAFESLVERALQDESFQFDAPRVLAQIERVMTALGVMPFDEAALPPEKQDAL